MRKSSRLTDGILAAVLLMLSGIILCSVGYAGDSFAFMWQSHFQSLNGLELLPPLSRWFADSYGNNNGEFLGTSLALWSTLLALTLGCFFLQKEVFLRRFLISYLLFWSATMAYWAFLLFCASLPFHYLISTFEVPRTGIWYANRILVWAPLIVIIGIFVKKIIFNKSNPSEPLHLPSAHE